MEARGCWCSVPARVAGALGLNPFRPQIFDIPEKHLENERRKAPRLEKKRGMHSAKFERARRFDSCSAISWENSHRMRLIWNVMWTLSVKPSELKVHRLVSRMFYKNKNKKSPHGTHLVFTMLVEVKIKFQVKGMKTKHIRQLIQLTISL